MKKEIKKLYTCDACHETFEKGQTDEEANIEAKNLHRVENASENQDMAIVCDDCFNKMRKQGLF